MAVAAAVLPAYALGSVAAVACRQPLPGGVSRRWRLLRLTQRMCPLLFASVLQPLASS